MDYQLDITISEEDYLQFNYFQQFRSKQGKKTILTFRLFFTFLMALAAILGLLEYGFTIYCILYISLLAVATVLYNVFFLKKTLQMILKRQIFRLKKTGKLPYDPVSKLEFHKDKIVESTHSTRMEKGYDSIERIYVVEDRYVYAFTSVAGAYVLPVPQIKNQINFQEFLDYLSQKCPAAEYHQL